MTPRGSAPGVRQSECSRGCPEYVVRCAHYDGDERVVWLIDGEMWYRTDADHVGHHSHFPFNVAIGAPTDPFPESCECKRLRPSTGVIVPDRAEANAAFERFEAQLLGREEAS